MLVPQNVSRGQLAKCSSALLQMPASEQMMQETRLLMAVTIVALVMIA
jgi:hypothetical protein